MTPRYPPPEGKPNTVSRSLDILEVVATRGMGVTAQEIAAALHMPAATAYRLLNSLVAQEYLVRTSDLRGFALGARLDELIASTAEPQVSTAARRELDQLRNATRFAVHLISYRKVSLRVLDEDPDHPVHAERELVRYLHASAAGKLILADRDRWQDILPATPLQRLTPTTVTNLALLENELHRIRRQRFAVQVNQLHLGCACLAIPVRGTDGMTAGALCIAGPASRIDALLEQTEKAQEGARILSPLLF
ncbi:IclR family transcriptional regulator [Saccharopolyspora mangrovi]|uniref:IclR family transcriptional regulator n=1 Tax=Saccharopolyspora mangrovi TaxID=3082379 RepID=A0ABU6AF02_9PSEU|nr:IclR family transcriptional regulator [Saccharopolyspora sp. S2-29]MEB3370121.1 IclR family transcriptional regulator [Saccharopolyspora sp. S2-29]